MIIITGIAGSGKSMQASMLAKKINYQWISVGQLLREKLTGDNKQDLDSGKLIDHEIVNKIVREKLDQIGDKCVLDGYPRDDEEVQWLVDGHFNLQVVIHLELSEQVATERLLSRNRHDDNKQAISQRFKEYYHEITNILRLFKKNQIKVLKINADQTIEKVHEDILNSLTDLRIK